MLSPLLFAAAVSYAFANLMGRARSRKGKRALLAAALVLLFGALFAFKDLTRILQSLSALPSWANGRIKTLFFEREILLPVGISFYTLQAAGYLADVFRGTVPPERNPLYHALFLSFFPQLTSGPISRASVLLPDLRSAATPSGKDILEGAKRILYGLFEKTAVADLIGIAVVNLLEPESGDIRGPSALIGILLYSVQILCDFRGYSHMAIGMAGILGIRLPENFRDPYGSFSVREFWKRWHMSLSSWLKDYVYIPLGGNRKGAFRTVVNLFAVFLLSGLWHGPSLTFLVWGVLHACFQLAEKILFRGRTPVSPLSRILRTLGTFLAVSFSWVFVRAGSLSEAFRLLSVLFSGSLFGAEGWWQAVAALGFDSLKWIPLLLSAVLFAVYRLVLPRFEKTERSPVCFGIRVLLLWMTVFSYLYLRSGEVPSLFLYTQF
ncbi:MAG: MBOAT family protein [Clostridia bacterium]|nr:MBOAT family protein [Clostridia bacterium]